MSHLPPWEWTDHSLVVYALAVGFSARAVGHSAKRRFGAALVAISVGLCCDVWFVLCVTGHA